MPLDEIGGQVIGGVLRVLGRVLVEGVFELGIRGVGYAILRGLGRRVSPDDTACAVTGVLFWAVAGTCAWAILRTGTS